MKSRITYIEKKAGGLTGPARIGRATFSKTGKTLTSRFSIFDIAQPVSSNRPLQLPNAPTIVSAF
jgi:hypothetical protein